jgi:methyl-accepting chemotaxis protein
MVVTSPQFPAGDKRLGGIYRSQHVIDALAVESFTKVVRRPPEGHSIVFSASRFATDAVRTARVLFDWTLVTQMDYRELSGPSLSKGLISLGFSLAVTLIVVSVGLIVVRRMTKPILNLDKEVSRLAQGYLDFTSTSARQDEIGSLERNTGEMVSKLREIVTLIDETVTATTTIGTTISTSVEQQSAISVEQAGSIAEISSTMDEFTSSFSQVSENVSSVADMVQHILKYVTESSRLIHPVADKIKDINNDNNRDIAHIMELKKRSKEIAKVMEIINNISDQTKIIAFNAALEASSAGEAGKRFGVVAAEIRNLTENVIQSTSSIDGIVGEIQTLADQMVLASEKTTKNITEGLSYSSESVENMESIVRSISASNDAVKQIVLSVQQQKSATAQIQLGLKELSLGAQQNSEAIHALNGTNTEFRTIGGRLSSLIRYFKLDRPEDRTPGGKDHHNGGFASRRMRKDQ